MSKITMILGLLLLSSGILFASEQWDSVRVTALDFNHREFFVDISVCQVEGNVLVGNVGSIASPHINLRSKTPGVKFMAFAKSTGVVFFVAKIPQKIVACKGAIVAYFHTKRSWLLQPYKTWEEVYNKTEHTDTKKYSTILTGV